MELSSSTRRAAEETARRTNVGDVHEIDDTRLFIAREETPTTKEFVLILTIHAKDSEGDERAFNIYEKCA